MYQESAIKKVWRVIYPVLLHLAIYSVVLFLGGFIVAGQKSAGPETTGDMLNRSSAYLTAIALVIAIPVLYIFYRKDYAPKSDFIFKKPKYLLSAIALVLLASHGLSLLISLVNSSGFLGSYSEVENVIYSSSLWLIIVRAVILAPVCEELIFRGLTFRRLKEYTGSFWIGAAASSAVFAVYHMNVPQGIFAFLFGIILCYVYDKFKNLGANIIAHAAGNALSVAFTVLNVSYLSPVLYIIIMVAVLGLAFALFYYVLRKAEVTGIK